MNKEVFEKKIGLGLNFIRNGNEESAKKIFQEMIISGTHEIHVYTECFSFPMSNIELSEMFYLFGLSYITLGSEHRYPNGIEKAAVDNAKYSFLHAIGFNLDHAKAHYELGNIFINRGYFYEAITAFKKAIEVKSDFKDAQNLFQNGYNSLFNCPLEVKTYALRHTYLARSYDTNCYMYDEAIKECNKAILKYPNFDLTYLTLGEQYARKGMYDEAVAQFTQASSLGFSGAPHFHLGRIYYDKGKYDEAIEEYNKAIEGKDVSTGLVSVYLGDALYAKNLYDQAKMAYDKAIRTPPLDPAIDHGNLEDIEDYRQAAHTSYGTSARHCTVYKKPHSHDRYETIITVY
jgi:tetratricopeptide (TPR) repeat protein